MLLFLFLLSVALGDRGVTLAVGVVSAALAVAVCIAIGSFGPDALQLRGTVATQRMPQFRLTSALPILKLTIVLVGTAALAIQAI